MFLLFCSCFASAFSDLQSSSSSQSSGWLSTIYPPEVIRPALYSLYAPLPLLSEAVVVLEDELEFPKNFDCRSQWPGRILSVRDQGLCGSCWAFGVVETLENRFSIKGCSRGHLSVQDLVSCDSTDMGCNGGFPQHAWSWVLGTGVTTTECLPYVSGSGRVPFCPSVCANGSSIIRYRATSTKSVPATRYQSVLSTYGPFQVSFNVYSDFMTYRTGVYQHETGSEVGGHSVLLMGWGEDAGVKFWLCMNSWGPNWGESGYFRILRGCNHCGIESSAFQGMVSC